MYDRSLYRHNLVCPNPQMKSGPYAFQFMSIITPTNEADSELPVNSCSTTLRYECSQITLILTEVNNISLSI